MCKYVKYHMVKIYNPHHEAEYCFKLVHLTRYFSEFDSMFLLQKETMCSRELHIFQNIEGTLILRTSL